MALKFCSFASGSSGNCYMVKSEHTTLLVDVGITGKRVFAGLEERGVTPEEIDGILITHEHIDHVRSLRMVSKKASNAGVFASNGTLNVIADKIPEERAYGVPNESPFYIGDIRVNPFHLSHDAAEPTGYSFAHDGRQVTIVTDTGFVSEEIFHQVESEDLLILEANHEVNILKMGAYPYPLKRRILGDEGHLSNEAAGHCLCQMLKKRVHDKIPHVVLAHLSKENNTPGQAYLTIRNILFEEDFYIDKDLKLDIANRDEVSPFVEV